MNCLECDLEVNEEDRMFCPGCWAPLESKATGTKGVKGEQSRGRGSARVRRRDVAMLVGSIALVLLLLGYGFFAASAPINTPGDPLTADHLFTAYALDQAASGQQYSGKVAYIKGTNSMLGVERDAGSGQDYISLYCNCALLYWQHPGDARQLAGGETFLAKCTIGGLVKPKGLGIVLYLQDCTLES